MVSLKISKRETIALAVLLSITIIFTAYTASAYYITKIVYELRESFTGLLQEHHSILGQINQLRFLLDSVGFSISYNSSFMLGCLLFVKASKKKILEAETKDLKKKEDYITLLPIEASQELTKKISSHKNN